MMRLTPGEWWASFAENSVKLLRAYERAFKALVLGSSPSRPTNKNNGLRWILSAKTVRTEICTETFIGFGFKSNRPTKFAIFAATAKPFLAVDRPLELIKPFFFSHREDPL